MFEFIFIFYVLFITQSINVKYVLITVLVSLHPHVTLVPIFNRLNFFDWSKHVQFYLGVLDLDLAFQVEKPTTITDISSNEEKAHYRAWEKSNRLSLMFMRMSIIK